MFYRIAAWTMAGAAVLVMLWVGQSTGAQPAMPVPGTVRPATPSAGAATQPAADRESLLKERLAVAERGLQQAIQHYRGGVADYSQVMPWHDRVLEAQLALPGADRVAILRKGVERAREYEALAEVRFKAGTAFETDSLAGRFKRLELELRLLEAEGQ